MCDIKPNHVPPTEDGGEEKDWAAAKAFFDNLKTNKPRPVSHFPPVMSLRDFLRAAAARKQMHM